MTGNRKDIEVASAGVHAVRGQPPSLYAVEVCAEEGTNISALRSQPLTGVLVDQATHNFAMTGGHVETIQTLFPQSAEKTFLLREFEEPGTTVWRDVPDPIGLGRDVYEGCARTIKNARPRYLLIPWTIFLASLNPDRSLPHRRRVTARHCAESIPKSLMRLLRKKN